MLLAVVGSVVYTHPMIEDRKVIMQVTNLGPVHSGDTSPKWVEFYSGLGSKLVIDRLELNRCLAIWENLKEGDVITLHHYLEYWSLFGKVIEKTHRDRLLNKNASKE